MMTNLNNLNNAFKLYEIVGQYIPPLEDIGEDYFQFVGKIVTNIREHEDHQAYFSAVEIMTGTTYDELILSTPEKVLDLFMHGMIEWRILELIQFFRDIGYHND